MSPSSPDVDVVVAGAGPAGLTAAIAADAAGRSVLVLDGGEEGPGNGLTLWPNATAALARLGVIGVDEAAGRCRGMRIVRPDGRVLQALDADTMRNDCGGNGLAITRRDLLAVLREHVPSAVRTRRAALCDVHDPVDGGPVRVVLDDTEVTAAVVVGADGRGSRVRESLWGRPVERRLGTTVVRGQSAAVLADFSAEMTMGQGLQFGLFPLAEGTYWFAAHPTRGTGEISSAAARDAVQELFAGWHAPIGDVLSATSSDRVSVHEMVDRPPPGPWGRGRVTLVGDAAHLAAPTMGQGTCHAFEDAVGLANALRTSLEPARLRRFEQARTTRSRALVRQSHLAAVSGRWSNAAVCAARDLAMQCTPASVQRRQMRDMFVFRDADVLAD